MCHRKQQINQPAAQWGSVLVTARVGAAAAAVLQCLRQAGSSVARHLLGIIAAFNTLIPNTHQLWTCWKWGTRCEKAGGSSGGGGGGGGGGPMAARSTVSAAAASRSASLEVTPRALQACPSGLLPPAAIPALGTVAGLREHDQRHTRIAARETGSHKAPFGRSTAVVAAARRLEPGESRSPAHCRALHWRLGATGRPARSV